MFCKISLSVKHFLLDCPGLNASRRLLYEVTSLKDLFNEIMPEKVLDFLSYVNLKKYILYDMTSCLYLFCFCCIYMIFVFL